MILAGRGPVDMAEPVSSDPTVIMHVSVQMEQLVSSVKRTSMNASVSLASMVDDVSSPKLENIVVTVTKRDLQAKRVK